MVVFTFLKPFFSLHVVSVSAWLPRALDVVVLLTSGVWHERWAGPLAVVLWETQGCRGWS